MRKLLLLLVCAFFSMGTRAADISGVVDGVTGNTGYNPKSQLIKVTRPGALAEWVAAVTGDHYDTNNPFHGLGGSDDFDVLEIEGELNANDLAALNSATCAAFSRFPKVDMSRVTLAGGATAADVCGVNFGAASFVKNNTTISGTGAQYILLPNGLTSAEEVAAMNNMKSGGKNNNLKMAGAYDNSNSSLPETALCSFKTNEVNNYLDAFSSVSMRGAKVIRMSGDYGSNDLAIGTNKNFTASPAAWDFTGASFATIKVNPGVSTAYYDVDDPFCDGTPTTPGSNYTTNAFYYFKNYAADVASLILPDRITSLPPQCLYQMGNTNESNYVALYGQDQFDNNKSVISANGAVLESLIIPDNVAVVDYECGVRALVRNIYFGSGLKEVRGGAFNTCKDLESVDFKTGTTNCRLGDRAFQEAWGMKHIVLSEGVTSIGSYCFQNSQQMESIRLPESLRYIGDFGFENNLALSSITIPSGVKKIGKQAFVLCPLTDVFLTATNPEDVPEIWTAGNDWGDTNSTFGANTMYGNNGIPWSAQEGWKSWDSDITSTGNTVNITWDEAVQLYYTHASGMAALHYPVELADKLLAGLSASYNAKSSDGFGLPVKNPLGEHDASHNDANKRASGNNGQRYMGEAGQGIYTSDGWAQFLLMREFLPDNPVVYTREYDDVWYTMCFPFDLTDEQLATAFNEGFNIVDFSGVEVVEADDPANESGNQTLTIHFNTVAKTTYKDREGNIYEPTGTRTTHGAFSYNDFRKKSTGEIFKHVQIVEKGKTKTFAKDGDKNNEIVLIDGVLAEAGHPYMVHPNTGVNTGMPLTRCHFSGITWEAEEDWPTLFENRKREIDLGVELGSIGETLKESTPSEENYLQAAYSKYEGQKYYFKGGYKQFRDDVTIPEELAMPTVENGKLTELPKATEYTEFYPNGPSMPASLKAINDAVGPKMTKAPDKVENPANDSKYASVKDLLMADRYTDQNNVTYKYYEELASKGLNDFFTHYWDWDYKTDIGGTINQAGLNLFKAYFNDTFNGDMHNNSPETKFAELQGIASSFAEEMEDYNNYLTDLQKYNVNQQAWAEFEADADKMQEKADYEAAMTNYVTAVTNWQTACATVTVNNNRILAQWEEDMNPYRVLIPKGSYFLGRRGRGWPRFYREIADENRENPTGGFWTQYTAIIQPDAAALAGVETELGDGTVAAEDAGAKGLNMVFDEGFMGFYDPTEIKQIVAEAEEKGQEVKYVDIVVSINGQVVRRGSTSLEGLPTGLYIVNGKKYYVK